MKMPNNGISELTYSESCTKIVITTDETQHPFTTETDRGGSRSNTYEYDGNGRRGRRETRGSRHITGLCFLNAGGEVLPPLYTFDSSAQNTCNFQVKRSWRQGLPKVKGIYRLEEEVTIDSFFAF